MMEVTGKGRGRRRACIPEAQKSMFEKLKKEKFHDWILAVYDYLYFVVFITFLKTISSRENVFL